METEITKLLDGVNNVISSLQQFANQLQTITLKRPAEVNDKKIAKKAKKDPNAPKKPLSSYFLFMQEQRPIIVEENPDLQNSQVQKMLAEKWQKMTTEEKQPYVDSYHAEWKKYQKTKLDYDTSHGVRIKDPNAPKKPTTSFFQYLKEKRADMARKNPEMKNSEIQKILSEKWQAMSAEEKQPYVDRYVSEKTQYDQDKKDYAEKLLSSSKEASSAESDQETSPASTPVFKGKAMSNDVQDSVGEEDDDESGSEEEKESEPEPIFQKKVKSKQVESSDEESEDELPVSKKPTMPPVVNKSNPAAKTAPAQNKSVAKSSEASASKSKPVSQPSKSSKTYKKDMVEIDTNQQSNSEKKKKKKKKSTGNENNV